MNLEAGLETDSFVTSRDVCEYLFVVVPDKLLTHELQQFQSRLLSVDHNLEPLPIRHTALASLVVKHSLEDIVSRWLRKACIMQPSFETGFHTRCSLNHGVVFLELEVSEALQALYRRLRVVDQFVEASGCSPVQVLEKPHLPLAMVRNTGNIDFQQLLLTQRFKSVFNIEEIAMLRRQEADSRFEKANVFGLSKLN